MFRCCLHFVVFLDVWQPCFYNNSGHVQLQISNCENLYILKCEWKKMYIGVNRPAKALGILNCTIAQFTDEIELV